MGSDGRIGWGIIGCGAISGPFAEGLAGLDNARLVAAAARDGERAADLMPLSFAPSALIENKNIPDFERMWTSSCKPGRTKN